MLKGVAAGIATLGLALVSVAALALTTAHTPPPQPAGAAIGDIPPSLVPVYQAAAATCPGLDWTVLAAVGFIESHHGGGRLDPATGQVDPPILGPPLDGTTGRARIVDPTMPDGWAHALGPMQFLSTTWAAWARLAPGRPTGAVPDVHNAWDAIYGAAAYLCGSAGRIDDIRAALFRYNRSNAYVDAVLAKAAEYRTAADAAADGSLTWPVDGPVVSGFGPRFHPILHIVRMHAGIDISAPSGAPIAAAASGHVTSAGGEGGCGLTITLEHPSGLRTRYCHLSASLVAVGESVAARQIVGLVGATGLATGPHLHFEVYDHGQLVDPIAYLPAR